MKKGYLISFIVFTSFIAGSYGQSVSFLNTPSDARVVAMGNAGYVSPTSFSVQYNSASVMPIDVPATGIGASLLLWQPKAVNSTMFNFAGYHKINNFGIMAGLRSNKMGNVEITDEYGNISGGFNPSELALEAGIGYNITPAVSMGLSFRYISSNMTDDAKASAFASDISMLYHKNNFRVGAGISNIGTKIDYGYTEYNLPTRIKSGVAYLFPFSEKHSVIAIADLFYQITANYSGSASGLGVEYSYNNMLFLRTGYHYESEIVGASYATAGIGGRFSGVSLDLGCIIAQDNNPLRQTFLLSLKWEN